MNVRNLPQKFIKAFFALTLTLMTGLLSAFAGNLTEPDRLNSEPLGKTVEPMNRMGESLPASIAKWTVPDGEQKAIVLTLHGFGLHKQVYRLLAEQLQNVGVSTYAMDVRGFGSWTDANSKSRFDPNRTLSDIQLALTFLRETNPDTPIFLVGESMGGALALKAAALNPGLVDGVIASVPGAERYQEKRTAFSLLWTNLIGNGAHINIGKRIIRQATNNPSLKQLWSQDPSARLTVSTSELITFSRFMHHSHRVASQITETSVLMLQGANDRLVKASATRRLFDELKTDDKDFLLVKKAEHLILEEGQFDATTLTQVNAWLTRHEEIKLASIAVKNGTHAAIDQAPIIMASR